MEHIPQLYILFQSKLWFSSEKAAALSPAALQVTSCCPQKFLMPHAYGAHNESSSRVPRVLQAVQFLISVCVHVLPFFILKLGSIKQ